MTIYNLDLKPDVQKTNVTYSLRLNLPRELSLKTPKTMPLLFVCFISSIVFLQSIKI